MNQAQVKTEDGLQVVHDQDSMRIVDPDGTISVTIHVAPKGHDEPFRVQHWRSTQEVMDAEGKVVARTTDPEMAKRICHLLIAHKIIEDRKAAAGT
jgi:hypothetical protein